MDAFGVLPRLRDPAAHGAAVEIEGCFNRGDRTTMADEGHDPTDHLRRGLLVGQWGSGTGGKRPLADRAAIAAPATVVDPEIPLRGQGMGKVPV